VGEGPNPICICDVLVTDDSIRYWIFRVVGPGDQTLEKCGNVTVAQFGTAERRSRLPQGLVERHEGQGTVEVQTVVFPDSKPLAKIRSLPGNLKEAMRVLHWELAFHSPVNQNVRSSVGSTTIAE